jgi:hypothetical protein
MGQGVQARGRTHGVASGLARISVKLRNPALALDLECVGIGPDINDKPAALCAYTAQIVCFSAYDMAASRALWAYDATLIDIEPRESLESFVGVEHGMLKTLPLDGERGLVVKLTELLDTRYAKGSLVTYNGRGYDLPVMLAAAARSGLPPIRAALRYMRAKRWDDDPQHLDLCEILAHNGAGTKCSLRQACIGLGIGDPKGEGDGANVAELVKARDGVALRKYSVGDSLHTAALQKKIAAWFD